MLPVFLQLRCFKSFPKSVPKYLPKLIIRDPVIKFTHKLDNLLFSYGHVMAWSDAHIHERKGRRVEEYQGHQIRVPKKSAMFGITFTLTMTCSYSAFAIIDIFIESKSGC